MIEMVLLAIGFVLGGLGALLFFGSSVEWRRR